MTTNNEAFEKTRLNVLGVIDKRTLSDSSYIDSETQKDWMLWQAATAEANKRIAELESEVAELKAELDRKDQNLNAVENIATELQAAPKE